MLPAAAMLIFFLAYPLGLGVWLGLTDTPIGGSGRFIGLENFDLAGEGPGVLALGVQHDILHGVRQHHQIRPWALPRLAA